MDQTPFQTQLVSYTPTEQEPNSGSNLGNMVSALQGNNNQNNQNQNYGLLGGIGSGINNFGKNFANAMNLGNPSSSFGGYNYNNMAQGTGLSGSDLAGAAQAGVNSGLTFDPVTGTVS